MDSLLTKLAAAREAASRLPVAPAAAARTAAPAVAKAAGTPAVDFAAVLAKSVASVDQSQQAAARLAEQFQLGAPGVTLEDTMVSLQKANISFQAMVQVRNKVVAAYNDIMNMQI